MRILLWLALCLLLPAACPSRPAAPSAAQPAPSTPGEIVWDGAQLGLGPPASEWASAAVAGTGFVGGLEPGAWVALHWDWVCDRLTGAQLNRLRARTYQQLEIANQAPASGPANVLT